MRLRAGDGCCRAGHKDRVCAGGGAGARRAFERRLRSSLPGVLPAAGSDGQPMAAQVAVAAEGTKNVLRRANEQPAQVAFFGDVSLWLALSRIVSCGSETEPCPNDSAAAKPLFIFDGQDEGQRRECSSAADLCQNFGIGIMILGQPFDLLVEDPDRVVSCSIIFASGSSASHKASGMHPATRLWNASAEQQGADAPIDLMAART